MVVGLLLSVGAPHAIQALEIKCICLDVTPEKILNTGTREETPVDPKQFSPYRVKLSYDNSKPLTGGYFTVTSLSFPSLVSNTRTFSAPATDWPLTGYNPETCRIQSFAHPGNGAAGFAWFFPPETPPNMRVTSIPPMIEFRNEAIGEYLPRVGAPTSGLIIWSRYRCVPCPDASGNSILALAMVSLVAITRFRSRN